MSTKIALRKRRARKTRLKIKRFHAQKGTLRLQLHRSSQNIYATILDGGKVLAAASTLSLELKGTKSEKAAEVGKALGVKAKALGITKVACDRSGFRYHGRIKALVESFRSQDIEV